MIIQILLYLALTVFCLVDHFQTVALIEVEFEELNPIVLWIIGENQDWNRLLIYKLLSLELLGLLLLINFYLQAKEKMEKCINIQKIKGLTRGWQSTSMALRKEGKHDSADIVDRCIDELTAFLLLEGRRLDPY